MKIQDKNILRDATAEEIAENNEVSQKINLERQTKIDEETARETLKASAKAKLIAGEALTEDEANTIVL